MDSDARGELLDEKWDLVVEDQSNISSEAHVTVASSGSCVTTNCLATVKGRGPEPTPPAR